LMAVLKNPETRDDILMRGVDAITEVLGPVEGEDEEVQDLPEDSTIEYATGPELKTPLLPIEYEEEVVGGPPVVVIQAPETDQDAPQTIMDFLQEPSAPSPVVTETTAIEAEIEPDERGSIDVAFLVEDLEAEGSLVDRLLCLREAAPALADGSGDLGRLVQAFPIGWARRRALVALLEAGLPADVGHALSLIEALERPVDRRWCLGILADRGDLWGAEAERALEMATSPTMRRRILRVRPS